MWIETKIGIKYMTKQYLSQEKKRYGMRSTYSMYTTPDWRCQRSILFRSFSPYMLLPQRLWTPVVFVQISCRTALSLHSFLSTQTDRSIDRCMYSHLSTEDWPVLEKMPDVCIILAFRTHAWSEKEYNKWLNNKSLLHPCPSLGKGLSLLLTTLNLFGG